MYLFKRVSDGAMIYGDNATSIYQGQLWVCPTSEDKVELRNLDGTVFRNEFDVKEVCKNAEGDFYTDIADFNAVSGTFFFRVSGGGVGSDGFLYLPNTATGLKVRFGYRAGFTYAIDQELIIGGFSGAEGVGWENIGGQ